MLHSPKYYYDYVVYAKVATATNMKGKRFKFLQNETSALRAHFTSWHDVALHFCSEN